MKKMATVMTLTAVAVAGCSNSSDSSSPSVAPSALASAIVTVNNKVAQADLAKYSTTVTTASLPEMIAPMSAGPIRTMAATNMTSSQWTSVLANVSNLYCGSNTACDGGAGEPDSTSSPKKWLDNMLDKSFKNSNDASVGLMGRLNAAVGFPCMVAQVLGGSTLPAADTYTKTITQSDLDSANSVCGTNNTIQGDSMDVTITVTDVTGSFDKKLHIVAAAASLDQYLYVKTSGTTTRVMTVESYTRDGVPQLSRYYADYDSSTKLAHFEGISRGFPDNDGENGGFYFYRVYVDETTKEVRILGQNGGIARASGTTSRQQSTMVGGHGNFNESLATMAFLTKDNSGATAADLIGCINMDTGDLDSGGACSGRAVDLTAASGADDLINTRVFNLNQGDWTTDETIPAMSFDATTIFAADATN